MTPEGKVKNKVKALLKAHGIWYYLPVSNGMGVHGIPDFLCCMAGRFLAIETKAGAGKCTALQEMQLTKLKEAGAIAFVINETNLEDLAQWLRTTKQQKL